MTNNRTTLRRLLASMEDRTDRYLLARITSALGDVMAGLPSARVLAVLQCIADTANRPPLRRGKIDALMAAVQSADAEVAALVRMRVGLVLTV